jgi:hypothetical protein
MVCGALGKLGAQSITFPLEVGEAKQPSRFYHLCTQYTYVCGVYSAERVQ